MFVKRIARSGEASGTLFDTRGVCAICYEKRCQRLEGFPCRTLRRWNERKAESRRLCRRMTRTASTHQTAGHQAEAMGTRYCPTPRSYFSNPSVEADAQVAIVNADGTGCREPGVEAVEERCEFSDAYKRMK